MKNQIFKVTKSEQKRLDIYLLDKVPKLNRSSIIKLIKSDLVLVNKKSQKAGYILKENDEISVNFDPKSINKQPKIELPILFEDKDVIVIDKPSGVLTHSKGGFNPEATVASFIKPKITGIDDERAGIVHRLDRATSGVIICAKNGYTLQWLQKQFSERYAKKTYIAVVSGKLKHAEGLIDAPIKRNSKDPKTFIVSSSGKSAQTEFTVVRSDNHYSLLELRPKTGRTHQLRVHLKYLGHPIVGDVLYGGEPFERLLLHAHKLEIKLSHDQKARIFVAPFPKIFDNIVK